jgi:hypothetical protein
MLTYITEAELYNKIFNEHMIMYFNVYQSISMVTNKSYQTTKLQWI